MSTNVLLPAIDLRGGAVVRLLHGDYSAETRYGDDPLAVAEDFADQGARWVHIVDLDAARGDGPINRPAIG
ncbi:MAG: HisA/HisF-related TIM barrel protein, partial [Ilumatobacteraceae bacterium]